MKYNIFYPFTDSGHGGANQFLKALKGEFINTKLYCENPKDADIIIFNAHQHYEEIINLKRIFPDKLFAHRMDGLYKLYNHPDDTRQEISLHVNHLVADCTVFQTRWALEEYIKEGFNTQKPHTVILNAPNSKLFKRPKTKVHKKKTRLVCTSWSINKNKGFDFYKYLDEKLDFSKYSFTYIGNDPAIDFKNIKKIGPLDSSQLAQELVKHDVFITASKHECCSNSLLEAMSCGLPAIGLNSGGTPELINKGGELFDSETDLLDKIKKVSDNLASYASRVEIKPINQVYTEYFNFFNTLAFL